MSVRPNSTLLTPTKITRVLDGDTIENSSGETIRFIGIDAPEVGALGANEATAFVRDHTVNQTVWLESDGADMDRFRRLRRYVWLQRPTDPTDPAQIQSYQLNAILLSNGLAEILETGNMRNAELFRTIAQPLAHSLIGNRTSKIFHAPNCRQLPAPQTHVHFISRKAAIDAGQRPCRICKP